MEYVFLCVLLYIVGGLTKRDPNNKALGDRMQTIAVVLLIGAIFVKAFLAFLKA